MTIAKHPIVLTLAVAVLTGCGGKVEVDRDAHASAGSGSGTGGGGGSITDMCTAFCANESPDCGGGVHSCEDVCTTRLENAGKCRDLVAKAYACHADEQGCSSSACDPAEIAADQCVTPAGPCPNGTFCGTDGTCAATCGGVEYAVECPMKKPDGTGTGTPCTCRVGGQVVGQCAATIVDPFIWWGCCAQYFAETK